jgi:putative FmdB family regulatory protein
LPTYEYCCSGCSYQYERREGFDAPPSQSCPRCGEEARRVLHAPPILFKASGFYATDNRKGSGYSPPSEKVESVTAADSPKASEPEKPAAGSDKTPEAAAAG